MTIYWVIWIWIVFANFIFLYDERNRSKFLFLVTMFFIFIFIGFRYKVGADWGSYLEIYEKYTDIEVADVLTSKEVGYNILNYYGNLLGYNDTIFVNIICALFVIFFFSAFALNIRKYWLALLVYFPYHILVVSTGYTRQSVAIAISLLAFYFLLKNRAFFFLLLCFFASLFHISVIILVVFYLLTWFLPFKQRNFIFYLCLIMSVFFLYTILNIYAYQMYENIYLQNEVSSKGVFFRWSNHVIPLFIYYKIRKYMVDWIERAVMDSLCVAIFFILFVGFLFSTISDRFNLYLVFFDVYVLFYAYCIFSSKNRMLLVFILSFYYTCFIIAWFSLGDYASSWVPYSNYISNYLFDSVF